jgi:hypothetical protein
MQSAPDLFSEVTDEELAKIEKVTLGGCSVWVAITKPLFR